MAYPEKAIIMRFIALQRKGMFPRRVRQEPLPAGSMASDMQSTGEVEYHRFSPDSFIC